MNARLLRGSIAAAAVGAALLVAGCGNAMSGMPMGDQSTTPAAGSPSDGSTAAQFNDADVMFAQGMIPHHEQAVAMSDTLLAKANIDPEVKSLATGIKGAQQPEIATMSGWLTGWGQPTGGMAGMNHGGDDGMATDAQLKKLGDADAATGQKLYLQLMTKHHQGAIKMAEDEVAGGKNPDAVALARTIETAQQAEITTMDKLLGRL